MTIGAKLVFNRGRFDRRGGDAADRGREDLDLERDPHHAAPRGAPSEGPRLRPLVAARHLVRRRADAARDDRRAREVLPIEPSFANAYGLTETHGVATVNGGKDVLERKTSIGRPLPILDMKIVDADGKELPDGQLGELADLRPDRSRPATGTARTPPRRPCATAGCTRAISAIATPRASTSSSTAPRT